MGDLDALFEVLPICRDAPVLSDEPPAGVRYVTEQRPAFVVPPFSVDRDELAAAQAVVVAAPAAVGKSMLAEHIALRTGGVLWDLAQARVGNNYAVGTLAASHGPTALGVVLERLWTGGFLIVADALDEARLRVTFDAFTAFLDDLASQVLKGITAGSPAVVLLARRESADFAADWLDEELDVRIARAEIDFFNREEALEFVRKQINAEGKNPDNSSIIEARDIVFARTLDLLGVDPNVEEWPLEPTRRFLGYAPVLVAAARYLSRGGNPRKIAEEVKGDKTPAAMWKFLRELLDDMLKRDQGKVVSGFRERHGSDAEAAGFSDWDALFSPQEQCDWLVSEALHVDPPVAPVPTELEDAYRSEIRGWLPEHPFVGRSEREFASPVFQDYVYSKTLYSGPESARAAVHARVADASYRPTEMLARFYFEVSHGAPLGGDDLTVLYEALLAAEEAGERLSLQLVGVSDQGQHVAAVRIGPDESITLDVDVQDRPLRFLTRLSNAQVITNNPVQLGAHGRMVELGPELFVLAPTVEVLAESISARKGDGKYGVIINTQRLTGVDHVLRFVNGGNDFAVQAEEPLRYPFADKAAKLSITLEGQVPLRPQERPMAQALFRLAGMFKAEGYGGLGCHAEPVERVAARNDASRRVLDLALDRGVVTKEGGIYQFHPELLGLDYGAVHAQSLSTEARRFVADAAAQKSS